MANLLLTQEARIYNAAKTASSINGAWKTGQLHYSWTATCERIKHLGINLPKETKELYAESYKTMIKEIN